MITHSDRALSWQAWGRDVRPATFWLSVYTGYVGLQALFGNTVIDGGIGETLLGALGVLAFVFMVAAWWARSVRMMLWGLAGGCWLWLTIAIAAVEAQGIRSVSWFGAFCWAGVAGGLWLRDHKENR